MCVYVIGVGVQAMTRMWKSQENWNKFFHIYTISKDQTQVTIGLYAKCFVCAETLLNSIETLNQSQSIETLNQSQSIIH